MNPSSDEGLNSVFNSLVDVANNARLYFTQGSISEALHLLQDVKRTTEYLEHRLPEQERAQRSSGHTESPQAGLAIHAKTDRQHDQGRGSISFSHTTHHGPPYSGPPQHLPSFKGPSSGAGGGHGQAYTSGSTTGGSLSRSGTVSDSGSRFPTQPSSYHQQHHGPGPSDYRERPTIQTNLSHASGPRSYGSSGRDHQEDSRRYPPPLTAPVSSSSSSSSSSLWSSPRAPVPQQHAEHGSSPGGAAGPFRQRHTSLPQVLNYNAPALPSPTREHPPPPPSHHSQHHHHHHHQPQHQQHQYLAQHSHQPHHSSSQQQPPPHHQPHYPSSIQHPQQHGQQQSRSYQQPAPSGQSSYHQSSPRTPHRYEGPLSSPRGSYFQETGYHEQHPTSPRTGRISSDRVPETIEEQLYYGEQEDRRVDRRISQGGPSPAHTPDHRARISSLVHPQDTRDHDGGRPGMHTPPRRGSGGLPGPSSSSSSLSSAAKGVLPFTSNGNAGSGGIHGSGPSPPQQHQHQLNHQHHHHHHSSGPTSSPTTSTPRGSRHSLTVTTLGSPLAVTSSGSSTLLHSAPLSATNTTPTVTTRGDNTGSRTQFHAPLEPEVIARLDDIFFKFLQRICSDLKACDSKGDHIHQPLMAKKMQRLEASTEFRPFKFRIQAFTNAFHDSLILHGLTEDILPLRKVKVYLWKHRYISRFNEDGKKQKSKGNHVWNIEARRIAPLVGTQPTDSGNASSADSTPASATTTTRPSLPPTTTSTGISSAAVGEGSVPIRWEFREYSSRIAGQIIKFARVGIPYVYSPRIWDAQMSCPDAKFSSPWLPGWLKWKRGELKGIPGPDDESCTITVIAEYVREGEECRLEMSFPLTVSDPSKEGELMDSQNEQEPENENEIENEDEDELEEDEDQDREPNSGHGKQRSSAATAAGRKTQGRQKLQAKKPRLPKQQKQQQPLPSPGTAPSLSQPQSPQQHRHSYSPQGTTETARQAASGGDGDEEQGSSYDDEDDEMDQEMMDEEDEIDDDGDDGDEDEMEYVDDNVPPRKKSRERRSLILVKDSQDSKRRKHIK